MTVLAETTQDLGRSIRIESCQRHGQDLRYAMSGRRQANQDGANDFLARCARLLGDLDMKGDTAFQSQSRQHSQVCQSRRFLVQRAGLSKSLYHAAPGLRLLGGLAHEGLKHNQIKPRYKAAKRRRLQRGLGRPVLSARVSASLNHAAQPVQEARVQRGTSQCRR